MQCINNRALGIFGLYSWSGGGVKALTEFGERSKWTLVPPVVEFQYSPEEKDIEQCVVLAQNMARQLKEGDSDRIA